MDDSPKNSEEVDVESRYKYAVWIFHALSTIDEENLTGNDRDIDGIAKYITDRHEVPEDFREELIAELGDLVSQGEIELVEGRYKVLSGMIEPREPEEASDPTNSMSSPVAVEPEGASDPTNSMSSPVTVEPEGASDPTNTTSSPVAVEPEGASGPTNAMSSPVAVEPEGASDPTNTTSSPVAVEPEGASDKANAMSSPVAAEPEGASDPTEETTSSDKSTSNEEQTKSSEENPPPHDQPSTSSSVRSESVKRLELKMLVNAVVAAEDSEIIAKEANDAFHTSVEMLKENMGNLKVANGILRNCANGDKVYVW